MGAKGTRGERTTNMRDMVVTLEVSQLSGWLKADAPCRVEGRACDAKGREVRAGRREGLGGWWRHDKRHARGPTLKRLGARARAERTMNIWDMVVTLEVSKLSGWLKVDAPCRVEGRACDAGGERCASREAGGPGVWWRHTRGVHGDGPTQGLWGARARAESALGT